MARSNFAYFFWHLYLLKHLVVFGLFLGGLECQNTFLDGLSEHGIVFELGLGQYGAEYFLVE